MYSQTGRPQGNLQKLSQAHWLEEGGILDMLTKGTIISKDLLMHMKLLPTIMVSALSLLVVVMVAYSTDLNSIMGGTILIVIILTAILGSISTYQYHLYSVKYLLTHKKISLFYRGKEKVTFSMHHPMYVTKVKIKVPLGGTSRREVDFILLAERPINPSYCLLTGYSAIKTALNEHMVLLPVEEQTVEWVWTNLGVRLVPRYPKVAFATPINLS